MNAEQILAAVKSEATAFGRCCECYQDGLGGFCCHECGQKTMAMLSGVQRVLGVHGKDGTPVPAMDREESIRAALVRRAAPDLLAALELLLAWGGRGKYAIDEAQAAIAKATQPDPL